MFDYALTQKVKAKGDPIMVAYALVDSGTSNTRIRLWKNDRLVASTHRTVGSRDVSTSGNNIPLIDALKDAFSELKGFGAPNVVICSGMIGSDVGLLPIPHLLAPATKDDLVRGLSVTQFPHILDKPFCFVPGVKILPCSELSLLNLHEADMMRGEETEIVGLLERLQPKLPTLFLHIGSHHKAILVDENASIVSSSTALTGELLASVKHATVLANTLDLSSTNEPPAQFWTLGADLAKHHGFGRAVFLARVAEQFLGCKKSETTAMVMGSLLALDIEMIEKYKGAAASTVIYGRHAFGSILANKLNSGGFGETEVLDEPTSDNSALYGAVSIVERAQELGILSI